MHIETGNIHYKLHDQIRNQALLLKEKYPLFIDHLNIIISELDIFKENFDRTTPITLEFRSQYYLFLLRIEEILRNIENGHYPYLADKKIHMILKKVTDNGFAITNNWVKLLVASNTFELIINDRLKKIDKDAYNKKMKDYSLRNKVEELNEYLNAQYGKTISIPHLENIRGQRNIVDHPLSELISQLDDNLVNSVITEVEKVIDILENCP